MLDLFITLIAVYRYKIATQNLTNYFMLSEEFLDYQNFTTRKKYQSGHKTITLAITITIKRLAPHICPIFYFKDTNENLHDIKYI